MPRRRLTDDDFAPDGGEPTARPTERLTRELLEEDDEKLVPMSNVGGAAPTPLGMDSGGDLPGPDDDLANLSEPEPPEPPEVDAVHVREDEGPGSDRS
ncbi:hypothetical protein [Anaeromyxobacter oryzae]|uniref:Uncharacterized protein n=1 Tax=Anaeromyxobacter oryzae TaxID=2918170 RepID=A0ABM7WVZ2_9BACT|nr:hypothetical protein [Anaeromyxobacter oryzae]BDG03671.1 hypothetical protein AMOR_26670 [Anaeromyxobacter oryzae]